MKYDLDERLINFASEIIQIVGKIPNSITGNHISKQITKSGTSPAANHGEAQSAESRQDFIHKMKIALKELRETLVWLKVLAKTRLLKQEEVQLLIQECNELISIFVKSIETARKNLRVE